MLTQDQGQHPDLDALARLQVPALPADLSRLLLQAYTHLGLHGAALQAAHQEDRLHLSGTEIALAADPGGEVLVAAADLGARSLLGTGRARQALQANALLMLHACVGVASGLGGPGSAQLIGRLHLPGREAAEVARWLAHLAGLARSIRDTARGPAGAGLP